MNDPVLNATPYALSLSKLLNDFCDASAWHDTQVSDLATDSRQVVPGTLFLACEGNQQRGMAYIPDALAKGASAILYESDRTELPTCMRNSHGLLVPCIAVPVLSQKVSLIASRFFGEPSKDLKVTGVTGTNGKTSCCHFIAQAFNFAGVSCAILGTAGNGFPGRLISSELTTLEGISLQRTLADFVRNGASAVAMEASSHGLAQGRVRGIHFSYALFTNLTRDHLDYHVTMEDYAEAKRQLFLQPNLKFGIVNAEDKMGASLLKEFCNQYPMYGVAVHSLPTDHKEMIYCTSLKVTTQGMEAQIKTPWGEGILQTSLLGEFNLTNLLLSLTTLCCAGIPLRHALTYLAACRPVCGRMQQFGGNGNVTVLVDYAHTPDALKNVLLAARSHCKGKLWCVFGCGGNRDRGKRSEMGAIAEQASDNVILTNDNPRHEVPEEIIHDIVLGIKQSAQIKIELDRRLAIHYALAHADKKDVIVIAGKGHENYQQIGDTKHPFSDQEIVSQWLKNQGQT